MTGVEHRPLVLGVGNVLLADDGVGVRVVHALETDAIELDAAVDFADGGTLGLGLLPLIAQASALWLVDAVDFGLAPGTVRVLDGREVLAGAAARPEPEGGIEELLATAHVAGLLPSVTRLVGLQPGAIHAGLDLSTEVDAAVPTAVRIIGRELRAFEQQAAVVRTRGMRPAEVEAVA